MHSRLKMLLTVSALGAAVAITPAFGQMQAPAQTQEPAPAQTPAIPPAAPQATSPQAPISAQALQADGNWRTSRLIGLNVYNQANESLGDINELIVDKSGKITAVIIGVGGFLGVGQHNVAVAIEDLTFAEAPRANVSAANTATNPPPPASPPAAAPSTAANRGTDALKGSDTMASARVYDWAPDHAVLNATRDQLKAMAAFDYSAGN